MERSPASQDVLPYEPPGRHRSRWTWFALGTATGVAATLLVVGLLTARARWRIVAAPAPAPPRAAAVARPPAPPPPSFTAAEDAGNLVTNRDGIGVPYGKFVFFSDGKDLVALRITCPSGIGRAVDYEWLHSPDGSAAGLKKPDTRRGRGSLLEKGGSAAMNVGPVRMSWSSGSTKGGWLYWPSDGRYAIARALAGDGGEFEAVLAGAEWRDREGRLPEPRRRVVAGDTSAGSDRPAPPRRE